LKDPYFRELDRNRSMYLSWWIWFFCLSRKSKFAI
jgi:hypothetical protein